MNLNQLIFRKIPIRLLYNNPKTSFSTILKNSTCYKCGSETTIPYFICAICAEDLGFKICYTKTKGHFIINTIPRKKNEIWTGLGIPDEVVTYFGEFLKKEEIDNRYGKSEDLFATYAIELSYKNDIYIDACSIRCLLSLLNSTSNPNCEFIELNEQIRLKFIRDIEIDTELTIYYDYDINDTSRTYQPDVILL